LGRAPDAVLAAAQYVAVFSTEAEVHAIEPDFARLAGLDRRAVIVTAPGEEADFVSRFFAPKLGIPEDPVTGSAHCVLVPYWAQRLGKPRLTAHQVSARGGELWCEDRGERVVIAGHAVKYLEGIIEI
jgi:predicted PhzF superfamily epimerase YddE/YHI9